MIPFNFIAKCQKHDLAKQIENGVQCFDIRVWFDNKNLTWRFAHGSMNYGKKNIDVKKYIDYIATTAKDPCIRIIFEKNYSDINRVLFINLCQYFEDSYADVKFFGGNYKKTWEKLYTFKYDSIDSNLVQNVGSMKSDARWYEKFIPVLYAKRMNKKNIQDMDNNKYNLFDFI
jgi:hypothetical protein